MTVMTPTDLVVEARAYIREVAPQEAIQQLTGPITVLDVREPHEHAEGHLPGAVNLPRGVLEFKAGDHPALADADAPVLVYCKTGGRGALAARTLQRLGYRDVINLAGGYENWCAASGPTERDPAVC